LVYVGKFWYPLIFPKVFSNTNHSVAQRFSRQASTTTFL
jgi:hypothetical protein